MANTLINFHQVSKIELSETVFPDFRYIEVTATDDKGETLRLNLFTYKDSPREIINNIPKEPPTETS